MLGALAGVRVVEFAQVVAVPVCGELLAGLGAEVIKVEPPAGDASRLIRPTGSAGNGRLFIVHNRGKRSIAIDLAGDGASEVVEALVASADVVTTGFKRSDLGRYGLSYEQLSAIKPDLIYLESTPYGPAGPLADMGGYDPVAMGLAGVVFQTAAEVRGAPRTMVPAFADFGTGFLAALGVTAALRHRDLTGEGQKVETSLLATAMVYSSQSSNWIEGVDEERAEALDVELQIARDAGLSFAEQQELWWRSFRPGNVGNATFRFYRCADGFISVACLSPGLVDRFMTALDETDPRSSPDWDPKATDADAQLLAWVSGIEERFTAQSCASWLDLLRDHGVPCAPVNTAEQAVGDPQVQANRYLRTVEQPGVGMMKAYAPPVRLSEAGEPDIGPAPTIGGDTDAICAEIGLDAATIAELRKAGVIS